MTTRVLIVDDSPVVRQALAKALAEDPELEVVGTVSNPLEAWDRLERLRPDVLTVDVEMPGMDGLTFLQRLMATRPMPVVIVSSKARRDPRLVLDALQAGALAVVPKPHSDYPLPQMIQDLRLTLRGAATARVRVVSGGSSAGPAIAIPEARAATSLIAVGSSTGGTAAFEVFARGLPRGHPCVVLAQHLPIDFVSRFAERLDDVLPSKVAVARGGEVLAPGHIFVAPATHHLRVRRDGARLVTELLDAENVNFHKPSVDVLLLSVASVCARHAVGVILTGMGSDGAKGLLAMRRAPVRDAEGCGGDRGGDGVAPARQAGPPDDRGAGADRRPGRRPASGARPLTFERPSRPPA
ncbi:MAG: chemotaxis-specific protein-glutamate methyltransferase CheB [Myxococcota bacterium]